MDTPFVTIVGADGVVTMKINGSLSYDNFEVLKKEVEESKRIVREQSEQQKDTIKVLFDLTDFTGLYNVEVIALMRDLEAANRPHLKKTAVFGGSDAARVAAEITVMLIAQSNIKIFRTKAEADSWLAE